MRDDNATPGDSDGTSRMNTANGRRAQRGESSAAADEAASALSDTPAQLSALSHPADVEEASLTEDEIEFYRRRVAEGVYNSREVAAEVARRMMRRGDI